MPIRAILVIQQHGISQYVVGVMWGCGYLNGQQVNLILPADGGQIINNTTEFTNRGFRYPGRWWEAQLAILQSEHGGFFVHSTDTTYRFKEIRYKRSGEYFGISFRTDNLAPFREKKEITWITWRLNAYRGDWQVPAAIYRNWMETAFQPKQPPAWVKDIDLVIYFTVTNMDTLSLLASHVNPSKTLLYLTNWRIGGWDENFPDYTPRPEFGDLLEAAHAYGFPVMLNTSFHGCSTYHPRYPEFEKHQFRHPIRGWKLGWKLNDPTHPERRQFAYINPASNAFRKYFIAQLKTVYETYPIEAFHLDTNHLVENDANGLIDGLTAAEGNVLLHQELAEAMPGVVFGGEQLHELTLPHVNFAQRRNIPVDEQPHPISSFLFSPSTILYGFHPPNPDLAPERYQAFQETYRVWDILPTLKVWRTSILHPRMVRTLAFLKSVRKGQSWEQTWNINIEMDIVGDVNTDGVVNVLDLVMVAQHLGTERTRQSKGRCQWRWCGEYFGSGNGRTESGLKYANASDLDRRSTQGDKVMRKLLCKCVCIVILQFVLVAAGSSNTLVLGEQGEVLAETDRYQVRFEHGVLVHFHNKLTQETYTLPPQGPSNGRSGLSIQYEEGRYGRHEFIDDAWEVESKRLTPLSVEVAYHSDHRLDKTVRTRIGIDADTGDLVIQQHGISKHIVAVTWGCGYLNSQEVDLILPAHCGEIIDAATEIGVRGYEYPERWEAQLAILQGEDGGFFVRSTDTTFRFKEAYYVRSAEHFGISFQTDNPAPFRDKNEITSVEWRLNVYQGDWQVPARIYRSWMETTFQPKEPPAWVKDLELVIYAPYNPLDPSILPRLAEHVNPSTTLLYVIGVVRSHHGT